MHPKSDKMLVLDYVIENEKVSGCERNAVASLMALHTNPELARQFSLLYDDDVKDEELNKVGIIQLSANNSLS